MFDDGDFFDPADGQGRGYLTATQIADVWRTLVDDESPWSTMALDDRSGYLRGMLDVLLDLTDGVDGPSRRRRLIRTARRHGMFRRGQALSDSIIAMDFATLRDATQRALWQAGATARAARKVFRVLLPDLRMARREALSGFMEGDQRSGATGT
ncbi:MAG TPA: hypothetical protein VGM50_20955 [Gemmatimonadaceae bacterium]